MISNQNIPAPNAYSYLKSDSVETEDYVWQWSAVYHAKYLTIQYSTPSFPKWIVFLRISTFVYILLFTMIFRWLLCCLFYLGGRVAFMNTLYSVWTWDMNKVSNRNELSWSWHTAHCCWSTWQQLFSTWLSSSRSTQAYQEFKSLKYFFRICMINWIIIQTFPFELLKKVCFKILRSFIRSR